MTAIAFAATNAPHSLAHGPPVARGRHPRDVVEGAHQRQRPGVQGRFEGGQMHVTQSGLGDLNEVVVHAWDVENHRG